MSPGVTRRDDGGAHPATLAPAPARYLLGTQIIYFSLHERVCCISEEVPSLSVGHLRWASARALCRAIVLLLWVVSDGPGDCRVVVPLSHLLLRSETQPWSKPLTALLAEAL